MINPLKAFREARQLSCEAAGALIGVTKSTWNRYETRTREITPEAAIAIERVTGIDRSELRPDLWEPKRRA